MLFGATMQTQRRAKKWTRYSSEPVFDRTRGSCASTRVSCNLYGSSLSLSLSRPPPGALVQGVLQQIVRCDIHPLGWFANIGGPNASALQCTNMTRDPSPSSCQWSPFWAAPVAANVSSQDVVLNGTACTRWEWWDAGQQWAFWGTATTPLRSAKLFTPHAGWSVWAIDFHSFVAEPAPLHAYAALPGADCPPSSVPPASSSSPVGSVGPGGAGGHGGALLAAAGNGAMRWGKWEPASGEDCKLNSDLDCAGSCASGTKCRLGDGGCQCLAPEPPHPPVPPEDPGCRLHNGVECSGHCRDPDPARQDPGQHCGGDWVKGCMCVPNHIDVFPEVAPVALVPSID